MHDGSRPTGLISGINVTPLVDVVLVLLVVLMVTATTLAKQSLPLELPEARSGESAPTVLDVSLDREGRLYVDGRPSSEQELVAIVQRLRGSASEVRVSLAADGHTEHEAVVGLMDLLRQQQVSRFAIAVTPALGRAH